ncbi:MAG: hypothetical protein Q9191_001004 [Dirinaria sp. TL-2023a]
MHTVTTFVLLASLLTSTLAFPSTSTAHKGRSFKAPLRRRVIERRDNGLAQAVALPQDYITKWEVPVLLGGQQVSLCVDTGSGTLWVYGPSANNPDGRSTYDPSQSSTSIGQDGQTFNASYGPGFGASGSVSSDSVNIGGAIVPSMPIGVADTVGDFMLDGAFAATDGILGIAFKYGNAIRPDQSPTYVEMVLPYLDQPVFAVDFREDNSGSFGLGAVDDTAYTGQLINVPVDNGTDGSWTVDGVSFGVGDSSFTQQMLFDTGGETMGVDPSVAAAYWGQVSGAVDSSAAQDGSGWNFPCGTQLPDFGVIFNGATVTIPNALIAGSPGSNPQMCSANLVGMAGRGMVGAPFWLSQYVVFNQADPSISFAPKA